jgi:hypothetical protein
MSPLFKIAIDAMSAVPRRMPGETMIQWHQRVADWRRSYNHPDPRWYAGPLVLAAGEAADALPESEKRKLTEVVNGEAREDRNSYMKDYMRSRRAAAKAERANSIKANAGEA